MRYRLFCTVLFDLESNLYCQLISVVALAILCSG
jgi:hypothetical protein